MGKILYLPNADSHRNDFAFATKSILRLDEEGNLRRFYFIVLTHVPTKTLVCRTGLERYVINLSDTEKSEETTRIAMSRVVSFLNYFLHETNLNQIHQISINEVRRFLIYGKKTLNGQEKKKDSWSRTKNDVIKFLENYYNHNNKNLPFRYTKTDFASDFIIKISSKGSPKKRIVKDYKALNVKAPHERECEHKNRFLAYGHLKPLLHVAKMFNPMIRLAIVLLAYAGIRLGEVVNLTFSDINIVTQWACIKKIELALIHSDRFRSGKTSTGRTKKCRKQLVYIDFLQEVYDAIEAHKDYLQSKGFPTTGDSPLFYNNRKQPMAKYTLEGNIRKLFTTFFVPYLKETSATLPFNGVIQSFIETYERDYPGSHMFRHWFTMYLITQKQLPPEMVRKWRGDAPGSWSYEEYVHINAEMIESYKQSAYFFQENLLEAIYE